MLGIGVRGSPVGVIPNDTYSTEEMDILTHTSKARLNNAPISTKFLAGRVPHRRAIKLVGYTELAGGGSREPISVKCWYVIRKLSVFAGEIA